MDMPPGTQMPSGDGMTMQMSFYWGKYATILFSGWPNRSLSMYLLALFFIFFLAAGVEVLKILTSATTKPHVIIQSCVYVFQMALAYMVMLSVMSFNSGVFLAAVIGHGAGHCIVKSRARVVMMKGEVLEAGHGGGDH
ncbi:hypothetical protein QQ045_018304 [Rhodiola kirilowii]